MTVHLVRRADEFDVIVTENMFGDILSDLAGEIAGSLGIAPSLNSSDTHAMAQAAHGSAPDIAGQDIANPIAMNLSCAMLLDWLGARHDDDRVSPTPAASIEDGSRRHRRATASRTRTSAARPPRTEFTAAVVAELRCIRLTQEEAPRMADQPADRRPHPRQRGLHGARRRRRSPTTSRTPSCGTCSTTGSSMDADARRRTHPALHDRMSTLIQYAVDGGADAVQLSCSMYGPVAVDAAAAQPVPVLASDQAMFEHVAELGRRDGSGSSARWTRRLPTAPHGCGRIARRGGRRRRRSSTRGGRRRRRRPPTPATWTLLERADGRRGARARRSRST